MDEALYPRCVDCKFWTGDRRKEDSQGECHRYPVETVGIVPQQNMLTGRTEPGVISSWPTAKALQWCGEFVQVKSQH